jgi:hypothetical protein
MYLDQNNNQVSIVDIKARYPDVSFPEDYDFTELGYTMVTMEDRPQPTFGYDVVMGPVVNGKITWELVKVPVSKEYLISEIVNNTSMRLNNFAGSRGYDSILSACTYATSAVPQFANEGQLCVNLRDATWSKLHQIMQEVEAGTRVMPSSFADIEPELPELVWS